MNSLPLFSALPASTLTDARTYEDLYKIQSEQKEKTEKLHRQLLDRCRGLLELYHERQWNFGLRARSSIPFVQLMHQTCKDFVLSPGFKPLFFGRLTHNPVENGFVYLAKAALAQCSNQPVLSQTDEFARELFSYSHLAERSSGVCLEAFIDSVQAARTGTVSSNGLFFRI